MKGLIIFLGESFRSGGQNSRVRGQHNSYNGQISASATHRMLLNLTTDAFVATYTTPFQEILLAMYQPYLVGHILLPEPIGLTSLFQKVLSQINIINYDYIFVIRIDLYLKPKFFHMFRPPYKQICFPSICWFRNCVHDGHPRVNDTMLYIPKQYFGLLKDIEIGHHSWRKLMDCNLTHHDLDTFLKTFHDSDSEKDYNPIYYIANRPICSTFHSPQKFFVKESFYKNHFLTVNKNVSNVCTAPWSFGSSLFHFIR